MEIMREKNRTFVISTSPNPKYLPVSLGVSAVPIVGCTLQPCFCNQPHSLGLPIREAGIRDHDIGSKARAWWKTKSMILTPFIHSSGDLERINTRSLRISLEFISYLDVQGIVL